jgi:hypothetical protein
VVILNTDGSAKRKMLPFSLYNNGFLRCGACRCSGKNSLFLYLFIVFGKFMSQNAVTACPVSAQAVQAGKPSW